MRQDTQHLFRRIFLKVIIFDVAILAVLAALSVLFTTRAKTRLAEQLAETFRAPLIAGDNRQIILDMPRPILKDFHGAIWHPDTGYSFTVPASLNTSDMRSYGSLYTKVFFDEHQTITAGRLEFIFNRWEALPIAVLSWLLLASLSVLIGHYEWKRILREYALSMESQINESRASLAAQVAHDIRSPLVALDAALNNTAQLPEKQRAVVRQSLNRIHDIANDLLERNRQQPGAASQNIGGASTSDSLEVRLLSSLIDSAITEKRFQFGATPGISINFKLAQESYGLFARIHPVEFGRLLSNLINNAAEALGDKGSVNVGLAQKDGAILLTIADNGKGIPPEILAKLGQRGETHGKTGGSGLGLFHARTTAESWGGGLTIASTPGKGTTVTIKLPQAQPPAGFVAALKLAPGRPAIVLDDDPGIHELWRARFETAHVKENNIEDFYFSEPDGLRAWVKGNPEQAAKALYLFDYELAGHTETGLSLAEELNLCNRTILITGRAEEKRIIDACAALKVRIIPKGLAGIVPISIGSSKPPARAVLLDDSTITQMTWEMAAEEAGVKLAGYTEPDKFMADLGNFPKDMPIYIDSELGENVKGENIAAELKEKGFTNICLATAHPSEHFKHLPWLRVRSKEAPWGIDDGTV